jgi:hypothetical protein
MLKPIGQQATPMMKPIRRHWVDQVRSVKAASLAPGPSDLTTRGRACHS